MLKNHSIQDPEIWYKCCSWANGMHYFPPVCLSIQSYVLLNLNLAKVKLTKLFRRFFSFIQFKSLCIMVTKKKKPCRGASIFQSDNHNVCVGPKMEFWT